MKLSDFIIGVGIFGVFTIVIFSMINPDNAEGIYGEHYLNITMDDETKSTIQKFADVGENATKDFGLVGGDIQDFTTDRGKKGEEDSEASLLGEGIKILLAIPRFFGTVASGLGEISKSIGIPDVFIKWAITSIIVIIVLMIATAFLRNRLQD